MFIFAKNRKIRIIFLILGIYLLFFFQANAEVAPSLDNQILLGTFNIGKLGKNNSYQAKNAASILKNYDIVAIQEVMNIGATKRNHFGTKGIAALQQIVAYLGADWGFVISAEPNGTEKAEKNKAYSSFEYYAFLFRKSKVELVPDTAYLWDEASNPLPELADQERQFDREPFIASFKAKKVKFYFTLINIHIASPGQKWRKDEIKRLAFVYKTIQHSNPNQNDIFLLGDFNTNVDQKEWSDLKAIESIKHILTSADSTTINSAKGSFSKSQYDTIWYQGNASDEDVIAETAEVHFAWQENIEPSIRAPADTTKTYEIRQIKSYGKNVSDHLPVSLLLSGIH